MTAFPPVPIGIPQALLLFFAALLGGALNSVAGGGSFLTFPSLLFVGVPAIQANATSTIALWPGSVGSVAAYRRDLGSQRALLIVMGLASVIGGFLGAFILLRTKESTFVRLVPWLLLLATLLFTFGSVFTGWVRRRLMRPAAADIVATPSVANAPEDGHSSVGSLVGIAVLQLVIATYGGFFGGGIGILMLASLSLIGMTRINRMNAIKTVMQVCINGVAMITFIVRGAVFWPAAVVMVLGGILGGYGGASIARRINPLYVRRFVTAVGFIMTAYFFIRG